MSLLTHWQPVGQQVWNLKEWSSNKPLNYCQLITLLSSKSLLVNISVPIAVVKSPVLCVVAADLSTHIKQVSTFHYKFYSIEMPPNMSDKQQHAAHMWMVWHIRQITAMFIVVVTTLLSLIISSTPEPYHMSIPSGQGWEEELLEGHPAQIQCELGVS